MTSELVGPICVILVLVCCLGIALYRNRRTPDSQRGAPYSQPPYTPDLQRAVNPEPLHAVGPEQQQPDTADLLPVGVLDSPQADSQDPQQAAVLSPSMLPERFVVFDLETTGFSPDLHEIIEFGAIRVDRIAGTNDLFQALVKPERKVPRLITEITGISQEMVESKGGHLGDLLGEFVAFIGDLPLVAFNVSFDTGFLQNAANKYGLVIKNRHLCAMAMARSAWPGLPSYQLTEIAKMMNLSDDDTHRAISDCWRTRTVILAAASILGDKISWSAKTPIESDIQHQTGPSPTQWPAHVAQVGNPDGDLFGEIVVFTGSLSMSRRDAAAAAADLFTSPHGQSEDQSVARPSHGCG